MELHHFGKDEAVKEIIAVCQKQNHLQQVAYSTYHGCLTQVCFTCAKVRTSLNDWKDAEKHQECKQSEKEVTENE